MSDFLIALGILVLLGVGVTVAVRVRKGGTEEHRRAAPADRPHPDRVAYEAEVAKAETKNLPPAEEAEVAELHAFFEEIGTGEQFLVLAFDADPLFAPIPDDRAVADPTLFDDVTANWLSLFTWTLPAEPAVPFASVQISEPPPLELESFTTGWTKDEIADILARGKAGASR